MFFQSCQCQPIILGQYLLLGEPQDHATSMLAQLQYLSARVPEQFPVHQPAGTGGQHLPSLSEGMRASSGLLVHPHLLPIGSVPCSALGSFVQWLVSHLDSPASLSTEFFMQRSVWELHPFTILFSFNAMTYFCRLCYHGSEIFVTNEGNCGCLFQVQAEDERTRSIAEECLNITTMVCNREASSSCLKKASSTSS